MKDKSLQDNYGIFSCTMAVQEQERERCRKELETNIVYILIKCLGNTISITDFQRVFKIP